jgi:molybdate transport system substrate-binding protein
MRIAVSAFVLACVFATQASAAEIRVLCANALNIAAKELAATFTKQTGHQVAFTFGTPGPMQARFDKGEPFELVILPIGGMEQSDKAGKFKSGTRQSMVRVGVGVAAKQGGKMPDLSSPEALKTSLLEAKAITYSDSSTGGLSGLSVQKVLANLGIADQIKAKAKAVSQNEGQAMVGRGEAEYGLYNVSEIPRAPGVVLAGPVPRAVQAYIIYDAAIPASNAEAAPATQLMQFFMSPAAQPVWAKAGLEIAKD